VSGLRLAIVTRRFWPLVGGAERAIANLAVELAARGCQVTILTPQWASAWPPKIQFQGLTLLRLPHPPQQTWATARYMRSLFHWCQQNARHYDAVCVSALRHEACAVLRALDGRLPVVLRAERSGSEGDVRWQSKARCGGRIRRQCLQAAAIVATSDEVQEELIAAGYSAAKVHRIPNGVPSPPARDEAARAAARAALATVHPALATSARLPLVVYTGHLHPHKGLRTLLSAWEPVAEWRPNARLWLAGDGPSRPDLERQIEASNLGGRALLVGVFDSVDELLAAADLFVWPALEAGTSMSLLEAMAAGLPIVTTDIAGNRRLVTHDQQALLVPPGNMAAMVAAMGRLLDDRQLAIRLGTAARARAAAEFSLAKMADQHLTLLHTLTALGPSCDKPAPPARSRGTP
jgi:glycosyltransferase involved in cell wall biosynthesis